jgi:hypothetical protein
MVSFSGSISFGSIDRQFLWISEQNLPRIDPQDLVDVDRVCLYCELMHIFCGLIHRKWVSVRRKCGLIHWNSGIRSPKQI